jgi:hypothetical protein
MSGAGGPLDSEDGVPPDIGFIPGPVDSNNHVFFQDAITYGIWWNAYHTYIPLPSAAVIPDGQQGTFYFQLYHDGGLDNGGMDIGVTAVPFQPYDFSTYTGALTLEDFKSLSGEQLTLESEPHTWDQFSCQFDIDQGVNSLKNSDGFWALGTADGASFPAPPINEWEEYWIYVDNAADIYNVYTRSSSTGNEVKEMYILSSDGVAPPQPDATFVASTDQPIIAVYYGTSAGNPGSASAGYPQYYDNYYMWVGNGARLETPTMTPPTGWCGMEKANGAVDSGSFMGWIYVGDASEAPSWVYCYTLNSWVYVASCPGTAGAWVFVPND